MATKRVTLTSSWAKLVDTATDPFTVEVISGAAEFVYAASAPGDADQNIEGLALTVGQGITRTHGDGHVYGRGSGVVAIVA